MEKVREVEVENIEKVGQAHAATTAARRPGYSASTPEEERLDRQVNLKMDLIVVPLLATAFLLQGIDKGNIGNAATSPSSRWIPILLLAWGAVTTAQCAIDSRADLYGLRLLLGICEAGFLPTAFYYVGALYPAYMAGLRMGFVSTSFTFSGAFSALIAYGILQMRSSRWSDWQLLFLIEGAITMGIGLIFLLILPHKLSTAWFFTPEERAHATRPHGTRHRSRCATVPAYGFAIFSPLIVKGMGFEGYRANLMCVPPFMLGAVALLIFVYISDRFRERSLTAAAAMFFSIIGYIALIAAGTGKNNVRYGFLFVIMIGAGSVNPLTAAWLNDNTPDKATRSIIMGLYRTSVCITLGIVAFGMLGFIGTRISYMLENKRRRKLIANWTEEEFEREKMDVSKRGHEKGYFMFGY
ncbi:hypothetical protein BDV12DRAFT_190113 [Aspergillus spectabilis]